MGYMKLKDITSESPSANPRILRTHVSRCEELQIPKQLIRSAHEYDSDRYDRLKRIDWLDLKRIKKCSVLVVGAGALGNEVCKNLVLSGYKNITIVDMDYIVKSNLNRCIFFSELDAERKKKKAEVVAEKLKLVNPDANIRAYTKKIESLGENFIADYDIVFGCVDNLTARLYLNAHCYLERIPYIDGATYETLGKVQVVLPPKTSCFECYMNKTHSKILNLRFSCTGKRKINFYQPPLGAEITTTSVIAAVQVREALKISVGKENYIIRNIFYYSGLRNISEIYEIPINPDCIYHNG